MRNMSGRVTATRNKYLSNNATVLQLFFKANNIQINSLFSIVSEVEHCFHAEKKKKFKEFTTKQFLS